jgi:hypothetical protein
MVVFGDKAGMRWGMGDWGLRNGVLGVGGAGGRDVWQGRLVGANGLGWEVELDGLCWCTILFRGFGEVMRCEKQCVCYRFFSLLLPMCRRTRCLRSTFLLRVVFTVLVCLFLYVVFSCADVDHRRAVPMVPWLGLLWWRTRRTTRLCTRRLRPPCRHAR